MLCENCNKNQATTHITRTVGGVTQQQHLCAECAAKMGYSHFSLNIGDIWGSLFGDTMKKSAPIPEETRCKGCGSTFRQIASSGKVGCAECYRTFHDQLVPTIQRLHGIAEHRGKLPSAASAQAKVKSRVASLKKQLQAAVESQEFERAAVLRDEIRGLEGEVKRGE